MSWTACVAVLHISAAGLSFMSRQASEAETLKLTKFLGGIICMFKMSLYVGTLTDFKN